VAKLLVAARPGKRRAEIERLGQRRGIPVEEVPRRRLDEFAGSSLHNGFGALHRPSGGSQEEHEGGDPDLLVLVEDVQDPRNLGAIARVCEGAGVGRLLIRDRGSAPISATVVKTSAGAAEWLPMERITNSAQVIESLQGDGFWVYGSDPAGEPPWRVDLTGKVLLCLGGEESGLRARTRKLCDGMIGLPMRGRVGSLNVATATAALLYEALRQRITAAEREGEPAGGAER
jgi:23S rRNA (guanosine2251-2'-O)-methyltransferase